MRGDVQWVQSTITRSIRPLDDILPCRLKVVAPTYYLFGQYNVMLHNRDGHAASLLGQYSTERLVVLLPVAFALKTSLPFLVITLIALPWTLWQLMRKRDKRMLWLLIPIGIYCVLSMTSHINIGIRHFLPVYPFLFSAAGALLDRVLGLRYPASSGHCARGGVVRLDGC